MKSDTELAAELRRLADPMGWGKGFPELTTFGEAADYRTHPDYLALLRAVHERSDDDLPRLVLADWLEERAGAVACPYCKDATFDTGDYGGPMTNPKVVAHLRRKCPCGGSGRVGDGLAERAEFIRLQCDLARRLTGMCRACGQPIRDDRVADGCPCNSPRGVNHGIVPAYVCTCPECDPRQTGSVRDRPPDMDALRRRERDLLDAHGRVWAGHDYHYVNAVAGHRGGPLNTYVEYERGFPAVVRGPLASLWRSIPCNRCDGNGMAHGSDRPFEWSPDPDYLKCPVCKGAKTNGHAGALAALGPEVLVVSRVEVTDREPYPSPNYPSPNYWPSHRYGWFDCDLLDSARSHLGPRVWAALPDAGRVEDGARHYKAYGLCKIGC